jgi:hypothetical protein
VGTTHGFEHGYDAFLGDPFGAEIVGDNLGVAVALSSVPEPGAFALTIIGLAALLARRKRAIGTR